MGRKFKNVEDRRVSVGVTLPYDLVQAVDSVVGYYGVTRTSMVETALIEFFDRHNSMVKGVKDGATYAVKTEA